MNIFDRIDDKLEHFAAEHNAVLTRNRDGQSLALGNFEERRIDWQNGGINLAVIIQPDFHMSGVDTTKWNFLNVVWQWRGSYRYVTGQDLIRSSEFGNIEGKVDELLHESSQYLKSIKENDLVRSGY